MNDFSSRKSWDTSIKHITRNGLLNDVLTSDQVETIPRSNISRWKKEAENKYSFCEINDIIKEEIELIKRLNQSSKIKRINQSYFKLADTFHEVISKVKGMKSLIKEQKELVINTIEYVKDSIPIEKALKIFNISRSTFENYKSIVIHKCEASYFHWCTRKFPHQLLSKEVKTIKQYMEDENYKFWSKSSVYLKVIRDQKLNCGLSTFYKYCRLLGFKNQTRKKKSDDYSPLKTTAPNQIWCADVTIFKTLDGTKNYIHFLMDHYSKMILGFHLSKSPSGLAIKSLLISANQKYHPKQVQFLTDGGSENVNSNVSDFINQQQVPIEHIIAQKDVVFSNSMVEALNKVMKHQFLYPLLISSSKSLIDHLEKVVETYNTKRPQFSLGGNTPTETYDGLAIDFSRYTHNFKEQKSIRKQTNKHKVEKEKSKN